MIGVVILIEGWDPFAGTAVSLRAGSHDVADVCHLNGATWWPAIAKLPTLRYDLFDGAFAGQITAPSSTLTLRTEPWPNFGRYQLADARIRLWTGEVGAAWADWILRFDGRLTAQPTTSDGAAEIAFAVDDRWLDTALLPTYAGTAGAEGPAALRGQVKPLSLGAPRYVSGTLVDSANSVFQVSAFAVAGVEMALERLARFGPAQADVADYAALVALALKPGTWATARAAGLVRFGAPPAGQISFLVQGDAAGPNGWVRRPGRVIRRLALLAGGSGRIDEASLTALDVARPYNVTAYLDQQTTARELIQSLAASINCVAGVSWTGQLFVVPVAIGAAADLVLAADGSALPPVERVQQLEQAAPFQKLAITAERTWTVHALADIAFTATLVDLGAYDRATTYREGNIVQYQGSTWRYLNPAPSRGNAPPSLPIEEDVYWRVLARAGADGTNGTNGKDGSSAYAVIQSNENHIVPADADGSVISYNGATSTVQVIYNGADVTSSFSLTAGDNPQALSVSISGRTVTVTGGLDAGEANALLGLILTGSGSFAGTTLTTSFSLTKSRAGADGRSPPLLSLGATAQLLRFTDAVTLAPGTPDFVFTATRQNLDAPAAFSFTPAIHSTTNPGTTVNGDVLTMTAARMGEMIVYNRDVAKIGAQVRINVTAGGLTDTITVAGTFDGAAGLNNATVPAYQRSSSGPPPQPTSTATYTFSTAALTGLNNGWSPTIPEGTAPLYIIAATASSTAASDTIAGGEWAGAVLWTATNNRQGLFIYQRAAAAPALPSANATYTFSSSTLSGLNNGWSSTVPAGALPLWVSTATALSPTDVDNINPGEWAAARVLAQNGVDGTNGTNGRDGIDGTSPIVAYLTNESFNVAAATDGSVAVFPVEVSRGQMKVYEGAVDVTAQCSFTIQNPFNLDGRIDLDGSYHAIGLYGDTGYSDLIASYKGKSYSARLTAAKAKAGANAPDISISASSQVARFAKAGNYVSGDIAFNTVRKNTAEVPRFTIRTADGTVHGNADRTAAEHASDFSLQFATSGPDNLVIIFSQVAGQLAGQFGDRFTVTARAGAVRDVTSVVRINDGADGAPGTDGFVVTANPAAFDVPCFANGTAKPTWTGGSCAIRLQKGGQNIAPDGGYSVPQQTGMASLAVNGATVTFAGTTADIGQFVVRAAHRGIAYDQLVTVQKRRDGSSAFRSDASFNGQGSAAGGGNTTVPANRTVIVSGSASYLATTPGASQTTVAVGILALYWRNATDDGPVNLLGEVQGSQARSVNRSGNPNEPDIEASAGAVSASFSFTSPSPDKQIVYSAQFRFNGSGGNVTGNVSLETA